MLGFRSGLDLATQTRLLQSLLVGNMHSLTPLKHSRQAGEQQQSTKRLKVVLDSLSKATKENANKASEDLRDPKQNGFIKGSSSDISSHNSAEELKSGSSRPQTKTVVVCAIADSELNKVEYAFFKRPLPPNQAPVILSDK